MTHRARPSRDQTDDDSAAGDPGGDLRSFGRRRARKFSPRQERLYQELMPRLSVLDPATGDLALGAGARAGRRVWLEIGFGGGEHLVWQARSNPDVMLVGCEPFLDGVAKVLGAIEDHGLANVRLHDDDVRPLLDGLPDACVDRCFVLFPDPWPKRRHVKRRLISPSFVERMARVMAPGAELRIGTDIADYARTILLAVLANPQFEWPVRAASDWRARPADWPQTRYEAKAHAAGRPCSYFRFRRVTATP